MAVAAISVVSTPILACHPRLVLPAALITAFIGIPYCLVLALVAAQEPLEGLLPSWRLRLRHDGGRIRESEERYCN